MKIFTFLSVGAISLMLIAAPLSGFAKEQTQSRHVVVKNVNNHSSGHGKSKRHYSTKKYHANHSSHRRYRHHNNHSLGDIIVGAAIIHSIGHHGAWYRGHPWCPSHGIYHTHSHVYYEDNYYRDTPRKTASYIELSEEGKCFRVTEYSNGDERKKRIRDHHCAEIEQWDDFEDPTLKNEE